MLIFILFLAAVFIGIPVCYAFALSGIIYLTQFTSAGTNIIASATFSGLDSFSILAIPFFMLAGDIMKDGGVSKRLVDFFKMISGKSVSSLGTVTVVACTFFGAISGSGMATVAAIGGIMIPQMVKDGYKKEYATALSLASGYIGGIIPPSIAMVVLCLQVSSLSIGKLFLCGVGPGLIIALIFIILNKFLCKSYRADEAEIIDAYGGVEQMELERKKDSERSKGSIIAQGIPALLMPVIILGGIYSGIFSATEAAVVSVVYGIIVSVFIFRDLKLKELPDMFYRSALSSGSCLFIYAFACIMGKILTLQDIPSTMATAVLGLTSHKILIILLVNIVMLLAGMVMDMLVCVILLAPVMMPIGIGLGFDAYQWAIMLVLNSSIGLITPPMAMNLFVGSKTANVPVSKLTKPILPFVAASLIALVLVILFPWLSTGIPSILGY